MKHLFKAAFAAFSVAVAPTLALANNWDWGHDPNANVFAGGSGIALCSGACLTNVNTNAQGTTAVNTNPMAAFSFEASGNTFNAGIGLGGLAQFSGLSLAGEGLADASKNDVGYEIQLDGLVLSEGTGNIVVGVQKIGGSIEGRGVDRPNYNQFAGGDGGGFSFGKMSASSFGGSSASAQATVEATMSLSEATNP